MTGGINRRDFIRLSLRAAVGAFAVGGFSRPFCNGPGVGMRSSDGGRGVQRMGKESHVTFVPRNPYNRETVIIAHRGANKFAPENTLPAYLKAIEMKLDYMEVDARITKDGRLVSMHDSRVDRTMNGRGLVRELTAEEIRRLDAGSWFGPEFAGVKVPFVEEIFEAAAGKIGIYLDLKDAPMKMIVDLIVKYGLERDTVMYASIDELKEMLKLCPDITPMPEGHDENRVDLVLEALEPGLVAFTWDGFSRKCLEKCRAAGAKIFLDIIGGGDNPDGMNLMIDWGVDGLQTDHPDVLLDVLERRKKERR